ncbi:acyl-CoA dehydrogenase family protein [Sciscionella marina]|uniref:acyl-CoA dehydrogenase family protein n=1 Tax=Sciscionella marina TaxID=508770 RepID=UPI00036A7E00|nr:acyl-CoA dehydrogenase [Sciscionella marina]
MTAPLGLDGALEQRVLAARQRAEPVAAELSGADFRTAWKALGAHGLLTDPESVLDGIAMIEGLGRAGVPAGLCYALTSQLFGVQRPLRAALGEAVLPDAVRSGELVLCHALTEDEGGSDPLSMRTSAVRREDGSFRLNGRKSFITAAPVADLALVFARTEEGNHPFALTPFLVDLDAEGVTRTEAFGKLALPEVPMGALEFTEVHVPAERMLGEPGSGLALLTATTAWERSVLLGYALGPMQRVLDRTVSWARDRSQFGRPMGASQLVAGRVAEMAMALWRSRGLVYGIARRLDDGESIRRLAGEAALTKISVSQDYIAFTEHATALGGVRSFVAGSGLTAELFGPLAGLVYAGPNDLLRVTVARELGLPVQN